MHALSTGGDDNELVRRLHEKYAHTPIKRLKEMAINGELDDIPIPTRRALSKVVDIECVPCAAGTKRVKKLRKNRPIKKGKYKLFELMVCDHAGPYPIQWGGYRFISVWVCACTGFTFTFKMHNLTAHTTTENAEIVLNHVNTQTNYRWQKLRSDRGPDWTSKCSGNG